MGGVARARGARGRSRSGGRSSGRSGGRSEHAARCAGGNSSGAFLGGGFRNVRGVTARAARELGGSEVVGGASGLRPKVILIVVVLVVVRIVLAARRTLLAVLARRKPLVRRNRNRRHLPPAAAAVGPGRWQEVEVAHGPVDDTAASRRELQGCPGTRQALRRGGQQREHHTRAAAAQRGLQQQCES